MFRRTSLPLIWLLVFSFSINAPLPVSLQQLQSLGPSELRPDDPLSYALVYARKSNNQNALSKIAVHYAKLGDFEEAMRVNESANDEDWRTGAFAEIALEYWKQGQKEKARQLFLRVAALPLPKDVIYIWGDIVENMAQAQQFDLALDTVGAMAQVKASTAGSELEYVVEAFMEAQKQNPNLPDILPRVRAIARTFKESSDEPGVLKKVAVAYAGRGEFARATKLVQGFKEEYDLEDGAHDVAIELAKLGQFDRALKLADKAGTYFGPKALIQIASEAIKRRNKKKALEVVTAADALISKLIKAPDYELIGVEVQRMSELAVLFSQLEQKSRSVELADLAFKMGKGVGKPGDRYSALQSVAEAYFELGRYDKAKEVAAAIGYGKLSMGTLADAGVHAQLRGRPEAVAQIVKTILAEPLKEDDEFRAKSLVAIARAGALRRPAETKKLLLSITPLIRELKSTEYTPEIRKDFAVAFAEAGSVRDSIEHIPGIVDPYFITAALIEIGSLCAKKGLVLDAESVTLLTETVKADLPPEIEPETIIKEAGWEIPGLAQARKLRPPELQTTRDRTIEMFVTYYEPEVETFIKRQFPSRREPKPEQAEWESLGLKVSLIEESVIKGHTFCYRLSVSEHFQDKVTGLPRYSDHSESLLYYDEDGDGKFETLEEGLGYFAPGHIPKWVLEK